MMRPPARLAAMALFACAFAAAGLRAQIGETTRWADPAHVKLGIEFPGEGYHAQWELFRCDCGDLLVRSELNAAGEVEAGESVLVGGRVVLSRGFAGDAELGASLDAPALMMQLALRLLERAEPGGPARVTEPRDVDLVEESQTIMLQSYAASGGFQAPWSLRGRLAPEGDTRRKFDLQFEFTVGAGSAAERGTMRLKGFADFAAQAFPLQETAKLEGWNLTWRDDDDPAVGQVAGLETVAQLRALLRESPP